MGIPKKTFSALDPVMSMSLLSTAVPFQSLLLLIGTFRKPLKLQCSVVIVVALTLCRYVVLNSEAGS